MNILLVRILFFIWEIVNLIFVVKRGGLFCIIFNYLFILKYFFVKISYNIVIMLFFS